MVVALGLIVGFYYIRRHNSFNKLKSKKSSPTKNGKNAKKKGNSSKYRKFPYFSEGSIPNIGHKGDHSKKKVSTQSNSNRTASILLHPKSIEQARLQYLACATSFQGLYEPLYQACQDKMEESAQKDLFKNWELRIKMTHSPHLELIWRSSINRVTEKNSNSENVLRAWLKYLKGWGLQRSLEAGQICWSLNGNIIEEDTQDSEKSI